MKAKKSFESASADKRARHVPETRAFAQAPPLEFRTFELQFALVFSSILAVFMFILCKMSSLPFPDHFSLVFQLVCRYCVPNKLGKPWQLPKSLVWQRDNSICRSIGVCLSYLGNSPLIHSVLSLLLHPLHCSTRSLRVICPLDGMLLVQSLPFQMSSQDRIGRWYFGGLASAGAACCTHPLDLLKVHLQTQQGGKISLGQMSVKLYRSDGVSLYLPIPFFPFPSMRNGSERAFWRVCAFPLREGWEIEWVRVCT